MSIIGKRKELTQAYTTALATHEALRKELLEEIEREGKRLANVAFGVGYTQADSYRDAVKLATDEDKPRQTFDRAVVMSDRVLMRAAAFIAYQNNDWRTLDYIAQTNEVRGVDEVITHEQDFGSLATRDSKFAFNMMVSKPSQPQEVTGYDISTSDAL